MDDETSPIYGTPGYQAPEIAQTGPTDRVRPLHRRADARRALHGLPRLPETYESTLAGSPDAVPLYAAYDSLYRFLARATALAPDDRFQTADEMADQLRGVLREVVAVRRSVRGGGRAPCSPASCAARSMRRTGARSRCRSYTLTIRLRPCSRLLRSPTRPNCSRRSRRRRTRRSRSPSARTRAMLELGDVDAADHTLEPVDSEDPWDWRLAWYRGLTALGRRAPRAAHDQFRTVYRTVAGRAGPQAHARVRRRGHGRRSSGRRWYDIVSRTDPDFTTAVFGLARAASPRDRTGAVDALDRVPPTSNASVEAQIARAKRWFPESERPTDADDVVVRGADRRVPAASTHAVASTTAEVFHAALEALGAGCARTSTRGRARSFAHRARYSAGSRGGVS